MPIRIISLANGLVDSKDSSLHGDGELSRTDDCYYKPNNPTPTKISGRVEFNSAAESGPILGGRFLEFDNANNLFVTMVGSAYRKADSGLTGTFTDLVTGLSGTATTLDSAHYSGVHYLMNGVDRNEVVQNDKTARRHGMLANTVTSAADERAGVLTGFTLTAGATMTYWIEERVKDGTAVLRRNSNPSSIITVITGDGGAAYKPVIGRTIKNTDATHWALFGTSTNGLFPTGAEIAEVPVATLTIEDSRTGLDPLIPGGSLYDILTATVEGLSQSFPRWGEPPTASTGDIFEDSLVTNDIANPSHVRYSDTNQPDAFPGFNLIRFQTKERDEVRLVRTLDNIVVVGLRDAMWRIETLPRAEDSAFSIERVKSQVHGAHGVVSALAATTFSFGQGLRLAYVSPYGVLVTDGFQWDVLTDDIEWESRVNVSALGTAVLRDNPRKYRLELIYPPVGETKATRTLFLHYHPSHAKTARGGGFRSKVTGTINRDGNAMFRANILGIDEIFSCNEDGKVYRHDTGNTEPVVAGGIQMVVQTGDIYPAGIGGAVTVDRLYTHHTAAPGQTATLRAIQRRTGLADAEWVGQIELDRREPTKRHPRARSEAFSLRFENSDSNGEVGVDYFVMDLIDVTRSGV